MDSVRCESEISGSLEECGRRSRVDWMSGSSVSMSSGSGIMGRGPENEAVREVRVRDWCVRCVVKASCAVLSLENVSHTSRRRRVCSIPCRAILYGNLTP